MTFTAVMLKTWQEGAAVFEDSGYSLFNIEAHLACVIVLLILFFRQRSSSDQTESQIIWSRMLFVQILYCISGIFRVLVDINIIPKSNLSQYIVTALNFGLFGCISWLTFVYIEVYQKSGILDSLSKKLLAAGPFLFNLINLLLSPLISSFIDLRGTSMKTGIFFPLMVAINLSYPAVAAVIALRRRRKMGRYERDLTSIMTIFPALFLICGPLQALNWRIPFLCYAIVISDIFVYITYFDSLISVDPLTKIANRNGFISEITNKFAAGNNDNLYLFAIDIEDLHSINNKFGRLEGDRALVITAQALKNFSENEYSCYIARYYGDEFMIIADIENDSELEIFTERIRNYVINASAQNNLKYFLRVNMGIAKYEQYSKTEKIAGLIDQALISLSEAKENFSRF